MNKGTGANMLRHYKSQFVKFKLLGHILFSVICLLSLPVLSHASVEISAQLPVSDSQSTTGSSAAIDNAQPSNTVSTGVPVTSAEIKLAQADTGEPSSDTGTSTDDTTASSDTGGTETSSVSGVTGEEDVPVSPSSSNSGSFSSIKLDMQSNSGFAATSIPIEVPLGRKEMTPMVSLNYNSGVKNSWLGVGWMLDVGAIQRNTKRGVNYSGDDFVYTINGASSELVYIGIVGNYREYRTKIEGEFSKYYYNELKGWIVTAKNGTKYYFGSRDRSRQDYHLRDVFKWRLDRVEDTNGNYMEMTYYKHQGEIYLSEINYTGNSKGQPTLPTTNSIKFILDTSNPRTDAYEVYNTHFSVKTAYRLRTIEVRSNTQLVRKYELSYEYSPGTSRSRLKTVTVHGHIEDQLPSLTFTYSEAVNGFNDEAIQWHVPDFNVGSTELGVSYLFNPTCYHINNNYYTDPRTVAAIFDFNGDALPDRVIIDKDNYEDMYVYKNNGSGFDDVPLFVNVNDPSQSQCQWGCAIINDGATWWNALPEYGSFNDRRSFDMNGDGMPDAVYWGFWWGYYRGRLWVGINTGHGYDNFVDWNWQFTSDNWDPLVLSRDKDGNVYQDNIDMNGDGLPDRVTSSAARSDGANYLLVSLNTGGGFSNTASQWNTPIANGAWKQDVRSLNYEGTYQDIIDMNGDGLPDRVTNGGSDYLKVYLNTGSGFSDTYIQWHTPISNSAWPQYVRSSEKPVFDASTNSMRNSTYQDIIDINGDGLPDRVTSNSSRSGNTLKIYLNTGNGFSDTAIDWHTPVTNSNWKQDVVSSNAAGASVSPRGWCVPYSGGVYQSIMDITGDGLPDRVTNAVCEDYLWVYPSNGPFPDLLTEVKNGLGGITKIEYAPSTEYANTYLPFVQHVVSKVTVYDGKGNQSITTFDYAGGYYSAAEREYRGFGYVKSTDTYGTVTETWYHQDDTYKGLIEAKVIKDGQSADEVYAWIENTYDSVSPYAGTNIVFPFLEKREEDIYDASAADPGIETNYQIRRNNFLNVYTGGRRHIITEFTYDDYGNPASRYEAEDPLQGDERTEYTQYYYDTTNYIVSLPSIKYITDSADSIKAQTWYTYYPDERGNLWKKESWLDGGINPVTVYEYDTAGYGNLWKVRDPKGYVTEMTYDTATQTFPTVIKNHLGHEIHKVYDSIFIDKVYTETDPNEKITTYEYDEFGRTKKITKPSPYGITEYYYPAVDDPDNTFGNTENQHIREEAKDRAGALMHFKENYFDGLGRTWEERSGGPGAQTIVVTITYDAKGRVSHKSHPYYDGDPVYETDYFYDPVDRLYYTENPDDTNSSIIYERGRTTYYDANIHKKVTVKDIYGRIVGIEEYVGNSPSTHTLYATTSYEYDVLSNLKKVTDAKGNQTTILYDTL